jgi:hypothetical protein
MIYHTQDKQETYEEPLPQIESSSPRSLYHLIRNAMEKLQSDSPGTRDSEKGVISPGSVHSFLVEEGNEAVIDSSDEQFLTGIKLYLTLASATICGFLISLDSSIVVTVCISILRNAFDVANWNAGYTKDHSTLSLNRRHRLVWECIFDFQVSSANRLQHFLHRIPTAFQFRMPA